jgi:hypothetical protein
MRYQYEDVQNIQQYNSLFNPQQQAQPTNQNQTNFQQALEKALEIRKFEIDLYWKRTTYFWAFIAIAYAGYFALYAADKISFAEKHEALLLLASIGMIFSFAWFLANKGSKFWQENWEKHVDMLEHLVYGPLYKTTLDNRQFSPLHITLPFQYSVSKINQILSLFVTFVWFFLTCREVSCIHGFEERYPWINEIIIGVLTMATGIYLYFRTRGGTGNKEFYFRTRKVID